MSAAALRTAFDGTEPLTIGLEEEVMLLDPVTLDLCDAATAIAGGGLKLELPASQVEIATVPARTVAEAVAQLAAGRERIAERAEGIALPAVAGVHPFAAPLGTLNAGEHYEALLREHGDVARAQLVCALQVHVAVGSAERALAVYNALRGHLPELAALAANAPFYAGRDSGFASVRPLIGGLLPRQGVPPAIPSWDAYAEMLRWTGGQRRWWWELRPHAHFGTLELRVCDAQTTLADASAVAAFAHALVAWLAERVDLTAPDSWRIGENRWSAARFGLDGEFADLASGERRPVRDVLRERLSQLAPVAERLGCAAELRDAAEIVERGGGAQRQRAVPGGVADVARVLCERFLSGARERSGSGTG
jgi:carboxylate-amine ligase